MNRTISTLTVIAAFALAAGSASAAEVRVSLSGKDAQTIRADIRKAAETVCHEAYRDASLDESFSGFSSCVDEATARVQAKVTAYLKSA